MQTSTKINELRLVFATANVHKQREVQAILSPSIRILSLRDINCHEEIPETSCTIEGNAIQKANYISSIYGYDCFAEDTGLEVDALNGAPGVLSARYAGAHKSGDDNMTKLLYDLKGIENRNARFKTVIALNLKGEQYLFEGIAAGKILTQRRGSEGFGYDAIFQPLNRNESFAEMSLQEKSNISHRGKAVGKLVNFLHDL